MDTTKEIERIVQEIERLGKIADSIDWSEALSIASIEVMRGAPYLMSLLGSMKVTTTRQGPIAFVAIGNNDLFPTMGINEMYFADVFDREGQQTMIKKLTFAVIHELLHVAFMHFDRMHERDIETWNIATDYTINNKIKESVENAVPLEGIFIDKFEGLSAEEIYDILIEEQKKEKNQGNKDGEQQEGNDDNGGGGGNNEPSDGIQSGYSKDGKQTLERFGDQDMSGINGMSEEQKERIRSALRSGIEQAKMIGHNGCGIVRDLEKLLEPKVDWRTILHDYIREIKDLETMSYKAPHILSDDVIFPVYNGETLSVSFVIDTSGSMTNEDIVNAVSEVKGVGFANIHGEVFACDAEAQHAGTVTEMNIDSLKNIELTGGGGTDMNAGIKKAIEFCEDGEFEHDVIIVITDGYIPPINQDYDENIIVLSLHNDCSNEVGKYMFIDFSEYVNKK